MSGAPEYLWRKWRQSSGTDKRFFMKYFEGVEKGFGIKIDGPSQLFSPIPLKTIKEHWESFRPPQSYRYLHQNDQVAMSLVKLICRKIKNDQSDWADSLKGSVGPLWKRESA
jgi:hypothetical protein